MSDDRMDRAERIRNMREGNRGTDDQTDTDAADGDRQPSSGASDDETGVSSLPTEDDETAADDGVASEQPSTESAPSPPDSATTSSTETATAASRAAEAVESETVGEGSTTKAATGTAADAEAAAQRAAESAAQVAGTDAAVGGDTADTGADAEAPAVPEGATGASTVPGDISGVELPDQQLLEEAMATSSVESTEGGARAAMGDESTGSEEVVRVLEFSLGEEYYCLDIEYVEEIVKRSSVTRVPNTPAFVDGVVDLRGQITTILEPKEMMDIETDGEQNLIIVFDPEQFEDQGAIGWVVDEVRQVVPVPESEINHPPVDAEYINGVVDREEYEQFVIWVEPEDALARATATEDE